MVFERLFGSGDTPEDRAARRRTDKSMIDWIATEVARLRRELGSVDRAALDEYVTHIREIERRRQHDEYTAKLRKRYYIDNLLARRDKEARRRKADSDVEGASVEKHKKTSDETETVEEGTGEEKKIRRLTPDD